MNKRRNSAILDQYERNQIRRQAEDVDVFLKAAVILCLLVGAVLFAIYLGRGEAQGAEIPDGLWKGVIAEAVSEGYDGMYAVTCVYKNRVDAGLPLGCCGLKRKDLDAFVTRQGKKYELMAKRIVATVFGTGEDVTDGATHYENVERFGVPYWAKGMRVTAKIGYHTFYKEGVKGQ